MDAYVRPDAAMRGFSLLEALIALVIFSIALLGLAGMYTNMMSMSHSSYLRTLATIQANDFEERMRANPPTGNTLAERLAKLDDYVVTCPYTGTADRTNYDKTEWCSNTASLFGGLLVEASAKCEWTDTDGNLQTCPDSDGYADYLVTIKWSERTLGVDADGKSTEGFETQEFEYKVRR